MTKKHDEVEQREEVTPPEVGIPPDFGDGSNIPPEGVLRRYVLESPPAPPVDAPIPPQDIKPAEGGGEEGGE